MDWEGLLQLGFSFFMCVLLFYKMDKDGIKYNEQISKLADIISKNTMVLEKILTKLDMDDDK